MLYKWEPPNFVMVDTIQLMVDTFWVRRADRVKRNDVC
jgi:hypothetical protein